MASAGLQHSRPKRNRSSCPVDYRNVRHYTRNRVQSLSVLGDPRGASGYPGPVEEELNDTSPIGGPEDALGEGEDGRYLVCGPHMEITTLVDGGFLTRHRHPILVIPERLPWKDTFGPDQISLTDLKTFTGVLQTDASASGWENCLTVGGGVEAQFIDLQVHYLRQFAIEGPYSRNTSRPAPHDRFSCRHQDLANAPDSQTVPYARHEWLATPREVAMGLPTNTKGEVLCHGLGSPRVPRFGRSVDISGMFMLVCGCVGADNLPTGECYRKEVYQERECPHLMWHAMTPVRTWEKAATTAVQELRSEIFYV